MAAHLADFPLHLWKLANWNRQLHKKFLERDEERRREVALLRKQKEELEKRLQREVSQVRSEGEQLNKALQEEIQRLSAEYQEEIRKVEFKGAQRDAVLARECQVLQSHSRLGQFPIDVTMANFDQLKRKYTPWYSPPIYDKGYKLCLLVHPNGTGDGKGTHVLVSVCLMKGEFDDSLRWPLKCSMTIELLNQTSRNHLVKTINIQMERVIDGDGALWPCIISKFVAHNDLVSESFMSNSNSSYLRNNSLQFRVGVDMK